LLFLPEPQRGNAHIGQRQRGIRRVSFGLTAEELAGGQDAQAEPFGFPGNWRGQCGVISRYVIGDSEVTYRRQTLAIWAIETNWPTAIVRMPSALLPSGANVDHTTLKGDFEISLDCLDAI
jgi:hypothetical protein